MAEEEKAPMTKDQAQDPAQELDVPAVIATFKAEIEEAGKKVGPMKDDALEQLEAVHSLDDAITLFTKSTTEVLVVLDKALEATQGVEDKIESKLEVFDKVRDKILSVKEAILEQVNKIKDWELKITDFSDKCENKVEETFNPIVDKIRSIKSYILRKTKILDDEIEKCEKIQAKLKKAEDDYDSLPDTLQSNLISIRNDIDEGLQDANSARQGLGKLEEARQQVIDIVWEVAEAVNQVKETIIGYIEEIKDTINGALEKVRTTVVDQLEIFDTVADKVMEMKKAIEDALGFLDYLRDVSAKLKATIALVEEIQASSKNSKELLTNGVDKLLVPAAFPGCDSIDEAIQKLLNGFVEAVEEEGEKLAGIDIPNPKKQMGPVGDFCESLKKLCCREKPKGNKTDAADSKQDADGETQVQA